MPCKNMFNIFSVNSSVEISEKADSLSRFLARVTITNRCKKAGASKRPLKLYRLQYNFGKI